MEEYIGNTYRATGYSTGSMGPDTDCVNIKPGDIVNVLGVSEHEFLVCECKNIQFKACEEWVNDCDLVGEELEPESLCKCSIQDLAGVGHLPGCAFIKAGGCAAEKLK